jgi:hypothetical protein
VELETLLRRLFLKVFCSKCAHFRIEHKGWFCYRCFAMIGNGHGVEGWGCLRE